MSGGGRFCCHHYCDLRGIQLLLLLIIMFRPFLDIFCGSTLGVHPLLSSSYIPCLQMSCRQTFLLFLLWMVRLVLPEGLNFESVTLGRFKTFDKSVSTFLVWIPGGFRVHVIELRL